MSVTGPWLEDVFSTWLSGKTVMAMLVTSAYVENPDSDVLPTAHEVSGTGYTAGGVTVSGFTADYDNTTNRLVVDCDDVEFGVVDLGDVAGIAFYIDSHVVIVDTFSPVEVSSRAFTYRPGATGLAQALIE